MRGTPFQEAWASVAREFDLKVQIPFRLSVGDRTLDVPVLLENFGAPRGMLLFHDVEQDLTEGELASLGFGYSCFVQPDADWLNRALLGEMLSDWGWRGEGTLPAHLANLLAR